VVIPDNPGVKT
jgi:hypothetical protein